MGCKVLDQETDAPEVKNQYEIVAYLASELPNRFINLIKATYLTSLRYGDDEKKDIHKESYFSHHSRIIDYLLKRPKCIARLALLSDQDTALGWSLSETNMLHFVWVRKDPDSRRRGIGASLVPNPFEFVTHRTNTAKNILKKFPTVYYDPYRILYYED